MCVCVSGVQEEVKLTLDCSQAAFITSDKMVISLKGGEMCVSGGTESLRLSSTHSVPVCYLLSSLIEYRVVTLCVCVVMS